jgi:hypothetical protein
MSFTIEQDREQTRHAFSLQSRAEITEIRLIEASLFCKASVEEAGFPLEFSIEFAPEGAVVEGGVLTVTVRYTFRITAKSKADVVLIKCGLQAAYDLTDGYRPSTEEIEAFRTGNAVFNCWPYFREFVQNTVTRMNYPPPTIPFLRLMPRPKHADDKGLVPAKNPQSRAKTNAKQTRHPN